MGACESEKQIVSFYLYESIQNMGEIKDFILKDELKAAVVNPSAIYHKDQILLAAHKAVYNVNNQQMKTKSIFTELLYCLFPGRSIRDSLKTFGVQENRTVAIIVTFNDEDKAVLKYIESRVKGTPVSMDRIPDFQNEKSIRKLYKVPESATNEEAILSCILTKIAGKELFL